MINYSLVASKATAFTRLLTSSMLLATLLAGCNNSMDLRSYQKESGADSQFQNSGMQSAQANALSLSEAASAARYINTQDVMHTTVKENTPLKRLPSESLIKQFAGRYTGQVPCILQLGTCSSGTIDMTLTLLPDGSAIRTLAEQGKVHAMLHKDTAAWTVSANGQNIMLILPNHEIWSFKKVGGNRLQFQPNASAMVESSGSLGQYLLVADNI